MGRDLEGRTGRTEVWLSFPDPRELHELPDWTCFTDEETEAQKGRVTCRGAHSWWVAEPGPCPGAGLTPKAGLRPQQDPEAEAQADTLPSTGLLSPGEGRLCWLLTEG